MSKGNHSAIRKLFTESAGVKETRCRSSSPQPWSAVKGYEASPKQVNLPGTPYLLIDISQLQEGTGEKRESPEKVENTLEADYPPQQIEMRGFISGTREILVIGGWMAEDDEEEDEQGHDAVPLE